MKLFEHIAIAGLTAIVALSAYIAVYMFIRTLYMETFMWIAIVGVMGVLLIIIAKGY